MVIITGTPVTNPVGTGAAAADQRGRGTDTQQSRTGDGWREVVNRLNLLFVTIGRLVPQLSVSAPAIQGTVSGPPELPPAVAVPVAETTWFPAAILRKEGTVGVVGAIWWGLRDSPELPLTAAVSAAETSRLPAAISPGEGMARPAGTIWRGPQGSPVLLLGAAIPTVETTRLPWWDRGNGRWRSTPTNWFTRLTRNGLRGT
ncbi:unnamed protein product [Lampetra planeri]